MCVNVPMKERTQHMNICMHTLSPCTTNRVCLQVKAIDMCHEKATKRSYVLHIGTGTSDDDSGGGDDSSDGNT